LVFVCCIPISSLFPCPTLFRSRNGGYYPYVVAPGLVELWARTASRQSSYRHTTPAPERADSDLLRLKAIDDAAKSAVILDVKAGDRKSTGLNSSHCGTTMAILA